MRIYELVFIIKPDLPEEEVDVVVSNIQETLEKGGATLDKLEKWGKRRLAYRVQKYVDGYYVLMQYSLEENLGLPKEVERRLRVADPVIKYLTVRIDEDLQRVEKLKAKREKRTTRRPAAAAAAAPGSPTPGEPERDRDEGRD